MEHKFRLLPGWVQVTLEHGNAPGDIVPVLAEATVLARKKGRDSILVISGVDDPATAPALWDSLKAMRDLGAPPPEKLAFVAYEFPQYAAYHFIEGVTAQFGFRARVFVSAPDARAWLQALG